MKRMTAEDMEYLEAVEAALEGLTSDADRHALIMNRMLPSWRALVGDSDRFVYMEWPFRMGPWSDFPERDVLRFAVEVAKDGCSAVVDVERGGALLSRYRLTDGGARFQVALVDL